MSLALSLKIAGLFGFALGVIQMTPPLRRKAKERGMSASLMVPFIFCAIGFISFVMGSLPGLHS